MFFATHPRDLVIYPLIPFMIGFYCYHKFGGLDWLFLAFWCEILGLYIAFVISGRFFNEFKTTEINALNDTETPRISTQPKITVNGVSYAQNVEPVKINECQNVAKTLWAQRAMDEINLSKVDLTERFWVTSGKYTRTQWVGIRKKLIDGGLIEMGWRKNSTPKVKDWHRVAHLVATGRMKRQ